MNVLDKYIEWKLKYINSNEPYKMLQKFKNNFNSLSESDKINFRFIFYNNYNKNISISLSKEELVNYKKCDVKIKYIIFSGLLKKLNNKKKIYLKLKLEKQKQLLGIIKFNEKRRELFRKRYSQLTIEKKKNINIKKKIKYSNMNLYQKKIFLNKQKELFNNRIINILKKELNTDNITEDDIILKKKYYWNNKYLKKKLKIIN